MRAFPLHMLDQEVLKMIIRNTDNVKEFKNGNINIHFTAEEIAEINSDDMQSGLNALINALDWADCYFVGDSYCRGNFTMDQLIYNAYSDVCYILDLSDIDDILMQGKTLKLYARKPDAEDREMIEREMGVGA